MEGQDMLREEGVHLLIGLIQQDEHQVKPGQQGTIHPETMKQTLNSLVLPRAAKGMRGRAWTLVLAKGRRRHASHMHMVAIQLVKC